MMNKTTSQVPAFAESVVRRSELSSVEPNAKSSIGTAATSPESGGKFHFAETFCERIVTVLTLFCRSKPVIDSFRAQVREHLAREELIFFKRAKNFVCWFRAYYLRNELPDVDGYKMKGPFRRWAFPRLKGGGGGRQYNRLNDYMWNSFFILKNCCLPVTTPIVLSELVSHHAAGPQNDTTTQRDTDEAIGHIEPFLKELAARVRSKYDELADPFSWVDSYSASNKASLDVPQCRGGEAMDLYFSCFKEKGPLTTEVETWGLSGPLSPTSQACKDWYSENQWDPRSPLARAIEQDQGRLLGVTGVDEESGELAWSYFDLSRPAEPEFFWYNDGNFDWYMSTPPYEAITAPPRKHDDYCYSDHHWEMMHWVVNSEDPMESHEVVQEGFDWSWAVSWSYPKARRMWREFLIEGLIGIPDYPMTKEDFDAMVGRPPGYQGGYSIEESLLWEGPESRLVAVKEPLKVRVLGVSDALTNYLSTWYQKTLHEILRGYSAFRLLGEAPVATLIHDLCANALERNIPGIKLKAMSSDFRGASNLTPKPFREGILERTQSLLPHGIKKVNRWCNGDHMLRYPWNGFHLLQRARKQAGLPKLRKPPMFQISRRGTQMGRKTSFPILSIEVFTCWVTAVNELYPGEFTFEEILDSCFVNGDDFLAMCSQALHDKFWEVCRRMQFDKSVGKSYFHEQYANINSQSYRVDWKGKTGVLVGALACGLLVGQKKLATDTFDATAVVTELLDSCLNAKMETAVMKLYLQLHGPKIRAQAAGRNLFIHQGLGGCGQRMPPNWSTKVSLKQQRIASFLLQDPTLKLCQPTEYVSPGLKESLEVREPWDVKGIPTYWEQVRKMQLGDPTQDVPLSPDVKVIQKDRAFIGFVGPLVKKSRLLHWKCKRVHTLPPPIVHNDGWACRTCLQANHILEENCTVCHDHRQGEIGLDFGIRLVSRVENEGRFCGLIQWDFSRKWDELQSDPYFNRLDERPKSLRLKYTLRDLHKIGG